MDFLENKKGIGILGINIVYLITAILLLTVGSYFQYKDLEKGLLITEYILVFLPPLIYVRMRGERIQKVFRLNKIKLKYVFLIMIITILIYPLALFLNLIFMTLLSFFGNLKPFPIPTAQNLKEYFVFMAIISISAGICEEVFFRGLVMYGYGRLGKVHAIIISALLFGLFHFNIQNFAGPVVLGLVFGYLVYKTDSLFAGIIGHATNNGIAVTLGFITTKGVAVNNQMPNTMELLKATFSMGIIAIITGWGAFLLAKKIKEDKKFRQNQNIKTKRYPIHFYIPILITIILYICVGYIQLKEIM